MIFDKRVNFKPFEYPDILKYKDAIRHSYWIHTEWNFISDVQDYHSKITDKERNVLKNSMLAIAQIEVAVKKFWSDLGDHFPKAEFDQVGITFGESEVRHSDAYSHLLEILSLNEEFETLMDNPFIIGRVNYLNKYLSNAKADDNSKYVKTLTLFSLFIENVSLFSQFLIIKAFNKHKNVFKDIDNVVQATQKEEQIHALFGAELVNMIRKENPDWFGKEFQDMIENACYKALEAEVKIVDWIFEKGDLDFIQAENVKEFLADRFNQSLEMIGLEPIFEVDTSKVEQFSWFEEEIHGLTHTDFFNKKSTNYSKKQKSVTAGDLF